MKPNEVAYVNVALTARSVCALTSDSTQQIMDRLAELETILERCKQREYNGFEPDNQSRLYHDICEALK